MGRLPHPDHRLHWPPGPEKTRWRVYCGGASLPSARPSPPPPPPPPPDCWRGPEHWRRPTRAWTPRPHGPTPGPGPQTAAPCPTGAAASGAQRCGCGWGSPGPRQHWLGGQQQCCLHCCLRLLPPLPCRCPCSCVHRGPLLSPLCAPTVGAGRCRLQCLGDTQSRGVAPRGMAGRPRGSTGGRCGTGPSAQCHTAWPAPPGARRCVSTV